LLGYNVEYSSISFALFFIGEYANILLMSTLSVILFLGGWLLPSPDICVKLMFILTPPYISYDMCLQFIGYLAKYVVLLSSSVILTIKIMMMLFIFIWVRAGLPRYRYDQLMRLGWKVFLPISLGYVFLTSSILYVFDGLPTSM